MSSDPLASPASGLPLRWIRSANFRRRYVCIGNGLELAQYLSFMIGGREVVERFWLSTAARISLGPPVTETPILDAWSEVIDLVDTPRSAFLLDTGYYKPTTLVGPLVLATGERGFLKHFSSPEVARDEGRRAALVADLAAGFFLTAPVCYSGNSTVIYQLLSRSKQRISSEVSRNLVIKMCQRSMIGSLKEITLDNYVNFDRLENWLLSDGYKECASGLKALTSRRVNSLTLCLNHGDCTPWNMFVDTSGNPCLIDYEDVDFRTPFDDFFHLIVQPAALKGQRLQFDRMLEPLRFQYSHCHEWLLTYLVKGLDRDLQKRHLEGKKHRQLEALIAAKARYFMGALALGET